MSVRMLVLKVWLEHAKRDLPSRAKAAHAQGNGSANAAQARTLEIETDRECLHRVLRDVAGDHLEAWMSEEHELKLLTAVNAALGRDDQDGLAEDGTVPFESLLEAGLLLCISEASLDRTKHVQNIMNMPEFEQAELKQIIERYMRTRERIASAEYYPDSAESSKSLVNNSSPRSIPTPDLAEDYPKQTGWRQRGAEKCLSCAAMEIELKEAQQREFKLSNTIEQQEYEHRHQNLNFEISEMEWIEKLEKKDKEIERQRQELDRAAETAARLEDCTLDMKCLRDEIQVLREYNKKTQSLEDQIGRYKEKLEEMSEMRKRLRETEEKHSVAVERALEMEDQIDKFRRTEAQLEDYKKRCMACETQVLELTAELQQSNKAMFDLKKMLEESSNHDIQRLLDAQQLAISLQSAEQQLQELTKGEGIGSGFSEFNSDLKDELTRLRYQNEQLLLKVDLNRAERISELEESLSDKSMKIEHLQAKYLETKQKLKDTADTLSGTRAKLEMSNAFLAESESQCHELSLRIQSVAQMAAEDKLAFEWSQKHQGLHIQRRAVDLSSLVIQGCEAIRVQLSHELDVIREKLSASQERETTLNVQLKELTVNLENASCELDRSGAQLKSSRENEFATKQKVEELNEALSTAKSKVVELTRAVSAEKAVNEDLVARERSLSLELTQKNASYDCLLERSQIDAAKLKRSESSILELQYTLRKIDREKRILEEDVGRARATSRGSDAAIAAQNYSEELAAVVQENKILRQEVERLSHRLEPETSPKDDDGSNTVSPLHGRTSGSARRVRNRFGSKVVPTNDSVTMGNQEVGVEILQMFEVKMQKLKEEKRELLMKNTALEAQIHCADSGTNKFEKKIKELQDQLTEKDLKFMRICRKHGILFEQENLPVPGGQRNR